MLAYKFRSAGQIEFALDIIFKRRLYCADWRCLNDPMEGIYLYATPPDAAVDRRSAAERIRDAKSRLKVCSLSTTFNRHLLWSHYADGFRGLAIEVELPEDSPVVKRVVYRGTYASIRDDPNGVPEDDAIEILSSKYREWEYEREVRIIQNSEWYNLQTPVRRIIVGERMNPAIIQALFLICEGKGIEIGMTGIGDEGIDVDPIPTQWIAAARRRHDQLNN